MPTKNTDMCRTSLPCGYKNPDSCFGGRGFKPLPVTDIMTVFVIGIKPSMRILVRSLKLVEDRVLLRYSPWSINHSNIPRCVG
jgi:hypothetical protein